MLYLDYAATTACLPEVIEAMLPFFADSFANAASIDHKPGNDVRLAVEAARQAVASLVGAKPDDVIFTSGATEANNLALSTESRVLTTRIEHPSVLETFEMRRGAADAFVQIDERGIVDNEHLATQLVGPTRTLVSVIATNNETGVEQDVRALATIAKGHNAMLHLDATQAVGTTRIDLGSTQGLVGVSLSAHKIGGPKGVGALIATPAYRRSLKPLQHGGGQERGLRSGTLNVPAIIGFGVAAALADSRLSRNRIQLEALRRAFMDVLSVALGECVLETVTAASVSPHVLSLRFIGTNGRALLRTLRDSIAFSLGSACATNRNEPSHVLLGLGIDKKSTSETVRFSFSPLQDLSAVRDGAVQVAEAVQALSRYSLIA